LKYKYDGAMLRGIQTFSISSPQKSSKGEGFNFHGIILVFMLEFRLSLTQHLQNQSFKVMIALPYIDILRSYILNVRFLTHSLTPMTGHLKYALIVET